MCLACRNREKAESARRSLLESFPGSKIDILDIDVSSVSSVIKAATELQRKYVLALHDVIPGTYVPFPFHHRYRHVDWLFFNAGIMPVAGVNWGAVWPPTPR